MSLFQTLFAGALGCISVLFAGLFVCCLGTGKLLVGYTVKLTSNGAI